MQRRGTFIVMILVVLLAAPAGAAQPLHHASGGGFFEVPAGGGGFNEFMFGFNARQLDAAGQAEGEFEQHNLTNGNMLHLEIYYIEFIGDDKTVWLMGEVTKSVGASAEIGDCRAVKLQDNGEGKNAELDMRSKLSSKCVYSDQDFGLFPLDGGNIRIR